MKRILIGLAFLLPSLLWAQVEQVEYFFDIDPGQGKGINAGTSKTEQNNSDKIFESLTFNAPLDELNDGFHTLYVRAKSKNGWSVTQSRPFVKMTMQGDESNEIEYMEYFFDKDPGYKNANALEVKSHSAEYAYHINLKNIDRGFHTLYVRALNKYGQWSQVMSRPLYIMTFPEDFSPEMIYAEYYLNNDPGRGKGTEFTYNPYQATIDFTAPLNHLNEGIHTIYLRGEYKTGEWQTIGQHTFTLVNVLSIDTPLSGVSVYPNPVMDELFIKDNNQDIRSVMVFNSNGQMVYSQNTSNQSIVQIPFSSRSNGTYLVKLITAEGERTFKIIKK